LQILIIDRFWFVFQDLVQKAIDNSLKARKAWDRTPLEKRCDVFLKAADLMANKYRMDLMASTMMGQV
jgi:1-pyrroline-5-carboxylate dehydrogenase